MMISQKKLVKNLSDFTRYCPAAIPIKNGKYENFL
jgi:hypothetical protein